MVLLDFPSVRSYCPETLFNSLTKIKQGRSASRKAAWPWETMLSNSRAFGLWPPPGRSAEEEEGILVGLSTE